MVNIIFNNNLTAVVHEILPTVTNVTKQNKKIFVISNMLLCLFFYLHKPNKLMFNEILIMSILKNNSENQYIRRKAYNMEQKIC